MEVRVPNENRGKTELTDVHRAIEHLWGGLRELREAMDRTYPDFRTQQFVEPRLVRVSGLLREIWEMTFHSEEPGYVPTRQFPGRLGRLLETLEQLADRLPDVRPWQVREARATLARIHRALEDLNWIRLRFTRECLEEVDYALDYATAPGNYVGRSDPRLGAAAGLRKLSDELRRFYDYYPGPEWAR